MGTAYAGETELSSTWAAYEGTMVESSVIHANNRDTTFLMYFFMMVILSVLLWLGYTLITQNRE